MRTIRGLILATSAAVTTAVIGLIRAEMMPLGVPGEWEWHRVGVSPMPLDLVLAGLGVVAYAGFVMLGTSSLRRIEGRARETAWVAALLVASVAVQVVVPSGAPNGYGLAKWISLTQSGSSGYLTVASTRMGDPWRFWADYPRWIKAQDALHIGTHPPGLFLVSRSALGAMESHPGLARWTLARLPASVSAAFAMVSAEMDAAERATAAMIGALTLLACAATVAPLYLLARASLPPSTSWAAASLWPLVPSAILFQPTADTAFPLLATSALALAASGGRVRAFAAGALLGLGMQFTLAFLPVGLAVAIVQAWPSGERSWKGRTAAILTTGAGFAAVTCGAWAISGANPLVVWWWNQKNHARFYVQYPRSYAPWILADTIELLIALGLPAAILAAVGFVGRKAPPSAWAALIVLVILNLSGKNLSEVARLWLPFMPALLVSAGAGLSRVGGGTRMLGATVVVMGFQTLALEATVQVVYPF